MGIVIDFDGMYRLKLLIECVMLIFSYVGC